MGDASDVDAAVAAAKVARPVLAAGCTMVLKPSKLTLLAANLLAEIMYEAGAPPGSSTSYTERAPPLARRCGAIPTSP